MFHVKLFFVCKMILHTTLSKHGVDSQMLSQENISELFLSLEFLQLFRENFFSKFIHKAIENIKQISGTKIASRTHVLIAAVNTFLV